MLSGNRCHQELLAREFCFLQFIEVQSILWSGSLTFLSPTQI